MLADWQPATGQLDYHVSHQAPHALRIGLARILRQPAHQLRVRCGDIGGSFGQKAGVAREDVAVCAAARLVGRPVKWIEDRIENLTVGGQARDERMDVEVAVDADGRLLGLRAQMVIDIGAYPALGFPASGFVNVVRCLMPAAYRLEHYDFDGVAIATNKATYVPYRGPWEMETWVRERLLDVVARDIGVDPVEVRMRNLLTDDELPRPSVTGTELMNITQRQTLQQVVGLVDYDGFRAMQRSALDEGRYLGIGFANFIEPAPFMPSLIRAMGFMAAPRTVQEAAHPARAGRLVHLVHQPAAARPEPRDDARPARRRRARRRPRRASGSCTATPTPRRSTSSAPVAAGRRRWPAARSSARRARSVERLLDMASKLWEIEPADLELVDGAVEARGRAARRMPLAQLGLLAYAQPGLAAASGSPGVEEKFAYLSGEGTWSQSTHGCIVEVDVATGAVRIDRYVVVEDCGQMINPAIVDGQVRGGVVQGIGSVLFEHSAYGDDGQFLAGTFMDYLLPTAADVPHIEVHHLDTHPDDDVPFRGVGEGGAIGAPAALTNAIEDALAPFGAEDPRAVPAAVAHPRALRPDLTSTERARMCGWTWGSVASGRCEPRSRWGGRRASCGRSAGAAGHEQRRHLAPAAPGHRQGRHVAAQRRGAGPRGRGVRGAARRRCARRRTARARHGG